MDAYVAKIRIKIENWSDGKLTFPQPSRTKTKVFSLERLYYSFNSGRESIGTAEVKDHRESTGLSTSWQQWLTT